MLKIKILKNVCPKFTPSVVIIVRGCDINPATNKKPTLSNKSATIHGQSYARDYVYKQITPTGMTYSISKSSFNYKRWEFWLTSAVTVNGKDKLNLKVSTGFLT